jgi:hypothetical protein
MFIRPQKGLKAESFDPTLRSTRWLQLPPDAVTMPT